MPRGARLSDIGGSERIVNRPSSIVYDPANPAIFWVSGIYGGPGIYKTLDGGKTFTRLGDITHNDYVSVDFSDPERRTLLAGGHEQGQTVYRSRDGGLTWKNAGRALPAGSGHSTHPLVLSALDHLVNTGGELRGIYRSGDGGDSWQRVSSHAPPGPPLLTASGAIYWAAPGRLLRSTDLGVTWTAIPVPGLRPVRPVELPGWAAGGGWSLDAHRDTRRRRELGRSRGGASLSARRRDLLAAAPGLLHLARRLHGIRSRERGHEARFRPDQYASVTVKSAGVNRRTDPAA